MVPRTIHDKPAWVGVWLPLGLGLAVGLTGVFMILCALAACSDGRQASLATPVLSYNGSKPFPAVIGESMALTPAVSGTIGHYTVSPPLPPGLLLDGQSGVISGTRTQARGPATYLVNARGAGVRASFPLVLSVTEPPNHLSYPGAAAGPVGTALSPLVPTAAGTIEHYAVTPALPRPWDCNRPQTRLSVPLNAHHKAAIQNSTARLWLPIWTYGTLTVD
jgi:hypothetical protein